MFALALAATALAVTLVAYGLMSTAFSEERRVHARMQSLGSYESTQAVAAEPMLAPFFQRVALPTFNGLLGAVKSLTPTAYRQTMELRLVYAGSPRGMDATRLLALQMLCGFGAGALTLAGRLASGGSVASALAVAGIMSLAFAFVPSLIVSMKASKRQATIRKDLPDMLDMLLISVEAGLGFDAAVAKIVQRTPGALGEEFGRMLQDGQAGLSRRESLKRLGDRNDVPELNTFIMAMVQADVFGISVSNILRAQARELRVKRRQRAQELAQRAPAKMVFPLILCVLPATLIVLAGPAVIAIGRAFGTIQQ